MWVEWGEGGSEHRHTVSYDPNDPHLGRILVSPHCNQHMGEVGIGRAVVDTLALTSKRSAWERGGRRSE